MTRKREKKKVAEGRMDLERRKERCKGKDVRTTSKRAKDRKMRGSKFRKEG